MPTYVYRCPVCGHEEEHTHSMDEDDGIDLWCCRHADLETRERVTKMERVIQPVGFRTPGDGFFDSGRV